MAENYKFEITLIGKYIWEQQKFKAHNNNEPN